MRFKKRSLFSLTLAFFVSTLFFMTLGIRVGFANLSPSDFVTQIPIGTTFRLLGDLEVSLHNGAYYWFTFYNGQLVKPGYRNDSRTDGLSAECTFYMATDAQVNHFKNQPLQLTKNSLEPVSKLGGGTANGSNLLFGETNFGFLCHDRTSTDGNISIEKMLRALGKHIEITLPDGTKLTDSKEKEAALPPRLSSFRMRDEASVLDLPADRIFVLEQDLKLFAGDNMIRINSGEIVSEHGMGIESASAAAAASVHLSGSDPLEGTPSFKSDRSSSPVYCALWAKEAKKYDRVIQMNSGDDGSYKSCLVLGKPEKKEILWIDGKTRGSGFVFPLNKARHFSALVCYKMDGSDVSFWELKQSLSGILGFYQKPTKTKMHHEAMRVKIN